MDNVDKDVALTVLLRTGCKRLCVVYTLQCSVATFLLFETKSTAQWTDH